MQKKKQCKTCHENKVLSEFYFDKRGTGHFETACKACAKNRKAQIHRRLIFNLTEDQFQALIKRQSNRCGICQQVLDFNKPRSFGIDHDHRCCPGFRSCGQCIRGLLCTGCNHGLYFIENTEFVIASKAYLAESKVSKDDYKETS